MLLNGTWRQHKTLTSNTTSTGPGHNRAMETECDTQVMHWITMFMFMNLNIINLVFASFVLFIGLSPLLA